MLKSIKNQLNKYLLINYMETLFIKKYGFDFFKLSKEKNIYRNKNYFAKVFTKNQIHIAENEYKIHQRAVELKIPCPKIIDFFEENEKYIFIMELLNGKSLADIYGEDPKKITKSYWKQIHQIIYNLYYNDIHYLDITPYNFILVKENNKDTIFIIDFGDAYTLKVNWFLKDFMDGLNEWNPDFK
jgi:tRNA A-37 threonylcarbamoyl transferase component Bud32